MGRTYDDWKTTDPSLAEVDSYDEWTECWQCAGKGVLHDCVDGFCVNAEDGCDLCAQKCDVCKGKGGWPEDDQSEMRQ